MAPPLDLNKRMEKKKNCPPKKKLIIKKGNGGEKKKRCESPITSPFSCRLVVLAR